MTLVLILDLIILAYLHMGSIGTVVEKLLLRNTEEFKLFGIVDLEFVPMTLILILDLNMVVTY